MQYYSIKLNHLRQHRFNTDTVTFCNSSACTEFRRVTHPGYRGNHGSKADSVDDVIKAPMSQNFSNLAPQNLRIE